MMGFLIDGGREDANNYKQVIIVPSAGSAYVIIYSDTPRL